MWWGFPHDSWVKNLPANARKVGSNPGSRRFLGGGNGNTPEILPEKFQDRGACLATVIGSQRVGHSLVTEQQ